MSSVATAHVAFGFAALAFGTVNVLRAKGTPSHRLIGHAYYASTLGLNGTAFGIYDFFGSFGVFHGFAVISLLTTIAAIVPVVVRRPRRTWKYYHAYLMLYSYLGLVAATAAEIAVRLPPLWPTDSPSRYLLASALIATAIVTILGSILIRRAMVRTIGVDLGGTAAPLMPEARW